ncbi:MAG TPA: hypothetical protein VF789_14625 [Thermoanaerobaculia bacterium]
MAWTLLLADSDGNLLTESYATLDDELVKYLAGLQGFPVFQGLRDLHPTEETFVDAEVRQAWKGEVAELAERVRRREGPEPPEWVGLEGSGDIRLGEELGWPGLLHFLQRLEHLLHLAERMGLEMWVVPEG